MKKQKKNQKQIIISWAMFNRLTNRIKDKLINEKHIHNIYPIPRGGFVLGLTLSHYLDVPMIYNKDEISDNTLIVDDINDEGFTLNKLLENKKHKTAVLIEREGSKYSCDFVGEHYKGKEWFVFPWEK